MPLTAKGDSYQLVAYFDPSTGNIIIPSGGSGSGTIADGADAAQGSTTDAPWSGTGPATEISIDKAIALAAISSNPVATLPEVTFNTTPPTLTNGQAAPLQGDASGNLKVVVQSQPAATPAASELHLGEVGGNIAKVAQTFGPSSSTTYTAGQVLLATTLLASMARVANGTGYIFGATLALNVANTAQVDLFIFTTQPTGTYTAGTTFTLTTADQAKLSKVIHLDDWTAAGAAVSFGQPLDKGPRLYRCDDTTATQSLWVVAVARGSITLAAASDGNLSLRAARN